MRLTGIPASRMSLSFACPRARTVPLVHLLIDDITVRQSGWCCYDRLRTQGPYKALVRWVSPPIVATITRRARGWPDRGTEGDGKQVSDRTYGEGCDPRLSVHAMSTRNWSLTQDLDLYERLGVRRTCVTLPKLAQAGIDDAVEAITSRGLQFDVI